MRQRRSTGAAHQRRRPLALRKPCSFRSETATNLDQPNPTANHQTGAKLHIPNGMARPERSDRRSLQRQDRKMVGPGRLELPTPRLSSVCSNQLSYGPIRVEQHCSTDPAKQQSPARINASKRGPCLLEKEKRRRRYSPYCGASVSDDNEVKGHFTSQQRMCFDGRLTGAIYVLKSVTKMSGNP